LGTVACPLTNSDCHLRPLAFNARLSRNATVLPPTTPLVTTSTRLKQAKKFVESVPKTLKDNLPKEEAEKLKKTLEALGATVSLE